MNIKQRRPSATNLHHIPSTSFSTFSSAASATSVGTSRSGGSRLLFGEIDLTTSETVASVCSLVLSDSSTFLKFWLTDRCREQLISSLPKRDLANLRLVCHDFSARAAPTLFQDLSITFKANTFTRPAKLAALDRVGYHVKHLTFKVPHTPETLLPPLIHPETGEELNFTYKPQTESGPNQVKYDDEEIAELLAYQYPPLFHAATNVPAFIRGLSCIHNLTHLEVSCPGATSSRQSRRSTVDFALISLRIAIERNHFNALDTLTLSPIHTTGLLSLSPLTGCGASPGSAKRWTYDPNKLLTSYLSTFQANLVSLRFAWLSAKGPLPFHQATSPTTPQVHHPNHHRRNPRDPSTQLFFPRIATINFENATAKASHLRKLAIQHASTLQTFELTDVDLTDGTWEEAFAPLVEPSKPSPSTPRARHSQNRLITPNTDSVEMADIPIMFTPPRTLKPSPFPSQRPSHPLLRDIHPSARAPRTPDKDGVYLVHQHHHRAAMKHPPPTPLASPLPKKMKRVAAPVQVVKKEGILGRVKRNVKRTFGG
ncbi:hypothetical protein MBLNU13_g03069t1 [Cladosporium sp. NU13]